MSDVTLQDFQNLCTEMYAQKQRCDAIEAELKGESKKLEDLKAKVLAHMELTELESYKVSGHGTIFIREDSSVQVPQSETDRKAFFDYLTNRGIFWESITVHSQKLNSLYKSFLEEAVEKGDSGFKVPGIGEPKFRKTLVMRSK